MAKVEKCYWNNTGTYQIEFERLTNKFMLPDGRSENLVGEVIRATNRLYYEYFNNGNCNSVESDIIYGEPYYITDFYMDFLKIIEYYFKMKGVESGIEAVNTLRDKMVTLRDPIPYSVYDNLVDIVAKTILEDEDNKEPIPACYKN